MEGPDMGWQVQRRGETGEQEGRYELRGEAEAGPRLKDEGRAMDD